MLHVLPFEWWPQVNHKFGDMGASLDIVNLDNVKQVSCIIDHNISYYSLHTCFITFDIVPLLFEATHLSFKLG